LSFCLNNYHFKKKSPPRKTAKSKEKTPNLKQIFIRKPMSQTMKKATRKSITKQKLSENKKNQ